MQPETGLRTWQWVVTAIVVIVIIIIGIMVFGKQPDAPKRNSQFVSVEHCHVYEGLIFRYVMLELVFDGEVQSVKDASDRECEAANIEAREAKRKEDETLRKWCSVRNVGSMSYEDYKKCYTDSGNVSTFH